MNSNSYVYIKAQTNNHLSETLTCAIEDVA